MNVNLLALRKERGLSQGQIAKVLGTSRQVVSRYERGECEMNYATLVALSKYFDVSIDYLLGNTTYFYPDKVGAYASSLPADEQQLLRNFRAMRADLRPTLISMSNTLAQTPDAITGTTQKKKA